MRRHRLRALAVVLAAALAACGDAGGALVEVHQGESVPAPIDHLRLFVGTPDDGTGGFAGVAVPADDIALDAPLADAPHSIELVRGDGLGSDTPVRVAVVGQAAGEDVALGVLDLPGIPDGVVARYDLTLEAVGGVIVTDAGCLLLPDGTVVAAVADRDCDGAGADVDCDDLDPARAPGNYDACSGDSLGVDDDCDGTPDDGDRDADGADCLRDCDDDDPQRTPGNVEDCVDAIDNDCDQQVDEGIGEICDDGIDNDCDPATPDQSIEEICGDGYDNDCDGAVDEGRNGDPDVDGDGALCAEDCDDDDEHVHPGATEVCNQVDDDCDQAIDENVNEDGDGALCAFDCDDRDPERFPHNPEICDTIDNDCDPLTHAGGLPCVAVPTGMDGCLFGLRACDELTGTFGDFCVAAQPPAPMPPATCTLANCNGSDVSFACDGEPALTCKQAVDLDHAVCPGATFPLVATSSNNCLWVILGGRNQQGWVVGLLGGASTIPQPSVQSCTASFEVAAVPTGLSPGVFGIALFVGDVYVRTEVLTITPEAGEVCPLPSLGCNGN